jgi:hypothetical protein
MELPVVIKIGYSIAIFATLYPSYSDFAVYFSTGLSAIGPTILLEP